MCIRLCDTGRDLSQQLMNFHHNRMSVPYPNLMDSRLLKSYATRPCAVTGSSPRIRLGIRTRHQSYPVRCQIIISSNPDSLRWLILIPCATRLCQQHVMVSDVWLAWVMISHGLMLAPCPARQAPGTGLWQYFASSRHCLVFFSLRYHIVFLLLLLPFASHSSLWSSFFTVCLFFFSHKYVFVWGSNYDYYIFLLLI